MDSAGVCSRCSAKLEPSVDVGENHDASTGICDECERCYAMMFDLYCPATTTRTPSRPGSLWPTRNCWRFSLLIDSIHSEARLTFTANGDSITLTLGEELSVIAVTRSETDETA